jgi:cytoskeletal protein CcmA (bactofilin family)
MKKIIYRFSLLCLFALFVGLSATPVSTRAAEIITETSVLLDQNNVYYENLYIGAGSTNISSEVNSDLTIVGGEVKVSSKVTGDIFVAGGNVDFSGQVEGDLRIIGGEVNITGDIIGDVLIVGGNVFVSDEATLLNDVLLIGGEINFESDSSKRLKVVSGKVLINGNVDGESEITTQSLQIGPDAKINGIFSYYSPQKFSENSGAEILGTINYNKINTIQDTGIIKQAVVNFLNFWLLLRFITTLIIAFILVYVFRIFSVGVNGIVTKSFFKSLFAGFLSVILLPIATLIFIISLVGMPIGFLLLTVFISAMIITPAVSGIFLGGWLRKILGKSDEYLVDFHSATVGVILFTILQFIPVIGEFLRFMLAMVALGAMVRYSYRVIIK